MKFSWVDWSYNVDRKECWRATQTNSKLSMVNHFTRMQQVDEYSSHQRNSPFKRYHKMNLHHVDKLPFSWQHYIEKEIKV